jgi:very-short-patch-repair endonuclease
MGKAKSSRETYQIANLLRKNQTPAEARLWAHLRKHCLENAHFRRQHPVGPYVVDFCAIREKLIIELDGGQHLDQEEEDQLRTRYLQDEGFRVLRFWNNDVLEDVGAVLMVIQRAIQEG